MTDEPRSRSLAELEQLLGQSPGSIDGAAGAIDAYFRHGILPEDQFRRLRSFLSVYQDHGRRPHDPHEANGG